MKELLVYLTAFACLVLWLGIIVPLIAKAFGVPFKFSFLQFNQQNPRLSRGQYILFVGVLSYGIGMSLFTNLLDLMEWEILGFNTAYRNTVHTVFNIVIWPIAGLVVGCLPIPKEDGDASIDSQHGE
jgi:hypothetical protein